jgi:hypothetical protein
MLRRDVSKALFATAAGSTLLSTQVRAQACTAPCFARTQAEINAGVTPTNTAYLPGDVRRYGADPTGVADSTVAINNALKSNDLVYAIAGTYSCSGSLVLLSGQTFFGDGSATVLQFSDPTISNIVGTGLTGTTVRDLKINVTGSASTVTTGGVLFQSNCRACKAERLEIAGVNWAGVWILASSYCEVRDCYFHDFLGSVHGSSDVIVTDDGTSTPVSHNIVEGNQCFGGGWQGVTFMQFYGAGGVVPTYNLASANQVGQHAAYGILIYNAVTNADVFDQIVNNHVENIQGSVLSGNSGAGIYCVSAGGCVFVGNTVKNCCVLTTSTSLAPAGIGISGGGGALTPFVVTGNHIQNHQNFYGIEAVGCPNGGTISGNTVNLQTGNPQYGIYVLGSSNVAVTGNSVTIAVSISGTRGVFAYAAGQNMSNVTISGNVVTGCSFRGISCGHTSGFALSNFAVCGNTVAGAATTSIPFDVVGAANGVVTGNSAAAVSYFTLAVSDSTGVRYANNNLTTTGTSSITTAGKCTGSYFDKTNLWTGTMANGATGLIVETLASSAPSTGTWAVGDRIEQASPAVGQPKGWRCTASGTPGTWVSEGTL